MLSKKFDIPSLIICSLVTPLANVSKYIANSAIVHSDESHPHFPIINEGIWDDFNILHGQCYLADAQFTDYFHTSSEEANELSLCITGLFTNFLFLFSFVVIWNAVGKAPQQIQIQNPSPCQSQINRPGCKL